ncbi:hypothetical protein BGZ46_007040 [Entomortierella lignicola]|nr:hypothetical protein BGZ46_007040 [Entomortierella lignicola]
MTPEPSLSQQKEIHQSIEKTRSSGHPSKQCPEIRVDRMFTPDRGRIMVATSFIPEGTLIKAITPQAIICDSKNRTKRCGRCFSSMLLQSLDEKERIGGPSTVACGGCCEIWYCGEKCRGQDWNAIHKYECAFLKRLYDGNDYEFEQDDTQQLSHDQRKPYKKFLELGNYEQDYCRMMLRILVNRFKEYMPSQAESPSTHLQESDDDKVQPFSDILDLVENRSEFSKELLEGNFTDVARIMDAFQTHLEHERNQFDNNPSKEPREEIPRLTMDELVGVILKEECNSFGLYEYSTATTVSRTNTTNTRVGYALGLYIQHYMYSFNHSCTPNIYHVSSKDRLLIFSARDILPGEELNIKYLEFGPEYRIASLEQRQQEQEPSVKELKRKDALEKRRAYLKDIFHFDCACRRCAWEISMNWGSGAKREEQEEVGDKFMREGLVCERDGCHGYYAPPTVLEWMMRDRMNLSNDNQDQQLQGSVEVEVERWGCVACGRLRG